MDVVEALHTEFVHCTNFYTNFLTIPKMTKSNKGRAVL